MSFLVLTYSKSSHTKTRTKARIPRSSVYILMTKHCFFSLSLCFYSYTSNTAITAMTAFQAYISF